MDIDVQHIDAVERNRFNPRDHPGAIAERPRNGNLFVYPVRFAGRLTRRVRPLTRISHHGHDLRGAVGPAGQESRAAR
ncbi:MAG: hypothetical protein OXH59_08150, partial [Rhodospirillaceae bacterium]|nr:hypothetical protein [Rhodospirillaceae bacterium]